MKFVLISILFLLLLPITVNAQSNFTFCYDPYPPYTIGKEGKLIGGLKVQVIDAVFNEIDSANVEVVLLPWKQCQKQTELGNIDGILPLFKNDQRASYMVFSDSVFDQLSVFWYKRSKFPDGIGWNDFEDLDEYKLGMLIGAFIDEEMEAIFKAGKGIHRGKSVENLFQLLLKDRVDLVAIDDGVGRYILKQHGWLDDIVALKKPIGLKKSYFGLSKKSNVSSYLDEINKVIAKLEQDGTIERIRTSTDY